MNEDGLERIEDALGHPLPRAFRHVMTTFPQELIDEAVKTGPDGERLTDVMMISPNVEAILAGIAHYQSEPGWPRHYVVVGENGCGEVYSVDVSQEKCPVFASGPHNDAGANSPSEEGYFEHVSADLRGWVASLVQQANDRAAGINPIEQIQRLLDNLKKKESPDAIP